VWRGLSPPSHRPATTRVRTAPVTALRAMPGTPKEEARRMAGLLDRTTAADAQFALRLRLRPIPRLRGRPLSCHRGMTENRRRLLVTVGRVLTL
jgi:hypothetical protein